MIRFYKIQESHIEQIGYDKAQSALYVKFPGGCSLYRYEEVPPAIVTEILFANGQVGSLLDQLIKKGPYKWAKLSPDDPVFGMLLPSQVAA